MNKAAIIAGSLCLAACAHQTPAVDVQVQRVEMPVPVPCIAVVDIPAVPAPLAKRPASLSAALDLAVAKVLEFTGYAEKADAVLKGCAKP